MAKRFVKFVVERFVVERFVAKIATKKLESKSKNYQNIKIKSKHKQT